MKNILLLEENWGAYIPQQFAIRFPQYVDEPQCEVLEQGPDHPLYWIVWDDIVSDTKMTGFDGTAYRLYSDGGLYAHPIAA
jgi:hypothetical protein